MSKGPFASPAVEGESIVKRVSLGLSLISLLCISARSPAGEDKVELKLLKYDQLAKLIADQKGKVVVVDFWADT